MAWPYVKPHAVGVLALNSCGFDEQPQLLQEGRADDLVRHVAFCSQALPYIINGAVITRSCELKCAFKCGRSLIHSDKCSTRF